MYTLFFRTDKILQTKLKKLNVVRPIKEIAFVSTDIRSENSLFIKTETTDMEIDLANENVILSNTSSLNDIVMANTVKVGLTADIVTRKVDSNADEEDWAIKPKDDVDENNVDVEHAILSNTSLSFNGIVIADIVTRKVGGPTTKEDDWKIKLERDVDENNIGAENAILNNTSSSLNGIVIANTVTRKVEPTAEEGDWKIKLEHDVEENNDCVENTILNNTLSSLNGIVVANTVTRKVGITADVVRRKVDTNADEEDWTIKPKDNVDENNDGVEHAILSNTSLGFNGIVMANTVTRKVNPSAENNNLDEEIKLKDDVAGDDDGVEVSKDTSHFTTIL